MRTKNEAYDQAVELRREIESELDDKDIDVGFGRGDGFRAIVVHFSDSEDEVEEWLDGLEVDVGYDEVELREVDYEGHEGDVRVTFEIEYGE